ncbi:MAG: hypothetical protein CL678_00985 [Bdellovibrionaceae bacterium]|nr:hypothetical protein [Pseudobdellovibrionaceae bacterium]
MVAPPVVAFYALGAMWLVVKYRILLANKSPPLYMLAEVAPAVTVAMTVVVAPHVPIGSEPLCADLVVSPLATASLLVGVLAPLFSHDLFWPGTSVVSAILAACYASRNGCVSIAASAAGASAVAILIRVHWLLHGCPTTTMYETFVPTWWQEGLFTKASTSYDFTSKSLVPAWWQNRQTDEVDFS